MNVLFMFASTFLGNSNVLAQHATDTTAHARVQRDYTYYWPGSCVKAVERTTAFYWREGRDTMPYTVSGDTMLTAAAAIARRCASQFSIGALPARALLPLAQTYLAAGNDSLAHAAIARRYTLDARASVAVRAQTLANVVRLYIHATPARAVAARETFRQLLALTGPDAAFRQVQGYEVLANYARLLGDDATAITMAEGVIATGKRLSEHDRLELADNLLEAYDLIAEIEGARSGGAERPGAIMGRARGDIGNIQSIERSFSATEAMYQQYGQPGPPITGTYWFGPPGDTVRPTPGKVSVISLDPARVTMPALRRLKQRMGDAVELAFFQRINGYYRNQGPLAPEEEAEILRRYYMDELKVPGVLVVSGPSSKKSLPDGRIVKGRTANDLAYGGKGRSGIVVVDKDGVIRRVFSGWRPWTERELSATVEKLR